MELHINILSRKSQENLAKASNKGGKVVSPTDSIDLGRCVAALSFIFGNVVLAFILSSFFIVIRVTWLYPPIIPLIQDCLSLFFMLLSFVING